MIKKKNNPQIKQSKASNCYCNILNNYILEEPYQYKEAFNVTLIQRK